MNVVAEGVETVEQLAKLKMFNCPYAQGYWFSRPIDSQGMTNILPNLVSRKLLWSNGDET